MNVVEKYLFSHGSLSAARLALAHLAETDLRYEELTRALHQRDIHDGDTRLHQLEHRQMRERVRYEREFTSVHEEMSAAMLKDLTSLDKG
jgi:hypothetical protein